MSLVNSRALLRWLGAGLLVAVALATLQSRFGRERLGLLRPPAAQSGQTPSPGALPVEPVASGLIKPRGLAFAPDGSLYIAEAGTGGPTLVDLGRQKPHTAGRSGRLSRLTPDGQLTTIADQLPSIVTAVDEPVGPSGLAFIGDQLYLLTAAGGWEISDPDFHNALFRVHPDGGLERVFDYSTYTLEHPTRASLQDPANADVPLGMPYGLTAMGGRL